MTWHTYKEKIKGLSQALVEAQSPIRILNTIKPDSELIQKFKSSEFKDIPLIKKETYTNDQLGFDPAKKIEELKELRSLINKELGGKDPLAELLSNITDQYIDVVEMLRNRGKKEFHEYSKKLYGSTQDKFRSDRNTIFEMAKLLYGILGGIKNTLEVPGNQKNIDATTSAEILNQRLSPYFSGESLILELSDSMVADAAAGSDKIRLRSDAMFSERDLDIYEVHEGWVHVGTSINGRKQPVAKWLSVGPPSCTSTQEGLAVLMEIFTFRTSVERAQIINDRVIAIAKAEEGGDLLEIFEFFRTEGYSEEECIKNSFRVFRGSDLRGKYPFTKDISYCKGFVENYNFMRAAIKANKPYLIPFLFCGKVHSRDVPLVYWAYREGLVTPPIYLPPQFKDINGIAVWMSFSSFFNRVDLKSVQADYSKLFEEYT